MLEEQIIKNSNELIKENYGSIVLCSKIDGRIDEDLFNKNLSKMYEVRSKFNQDKSKFNTFLTKCLYNNRTNYLRDNLNEEEIPVKKEQLNRFQDSLNISADVEKNELIDKITSYLYELRSIDRKAFEYRVYDNYSFREIGEILNISKQGACKKYYKVLKLIRRKFKRWL